MKKEHLFIAGAVAILVFVVIFLLVNYGISTGFDDAAFVFINQTLNISSLNSLFIVIAEYGREYFWIPVIVLLWIFGKEREKKAALVITLVFIVLVVIGLTLNTIYYRARPSLTLSNVILLIPPGTDSSFPSGHALITMGGATVALLMLRKRYSVPLLIEALLVCYSRIYVGVHYPMDVLGGAFLGAGIALIMTALLLDSKKFANAYKTIYGVYNKALKQIGL